MATLVGSELLVEITQFDGLKSYENIKILGRL